MPATRMTSRNVTVLAVRIVVASAIVFSCASGSAQSAAERKDPSTSEQSEFAPGVVTVIPPAPDPKETFEGPLTLQSLLDSYPEIKWDAPDFAEGSPHFDPRSRTLTEMAKQVILRREIYCFEFSFKPLRQIYVDLPRADGRLQRKLVWYMVFRVRYRGGDLRPAVDQVAGAPLYKRIEAVSYDSRRIFPMLTLVNHATGKEYVDRILPTAKDKIAIREQITAPLHNTVDISRVDIPHTSDSAGAGVWGVATWDDVDPNLDFLSINVFGLTNAFEQEGTEPDSPYRRKALQLNFFRPGDSMQQTEDRIRFGVPAYKNEEEQSYVLKQYGLSERLDYRWIFR